MQLFPFQDLGLKIKNGLFLRHCDNRMLSEKLSLRKAIFRFEAKIGRLKTVIMVEAEFYFLQFFKAENRFLEA